MREFSFWKYGVAVTGFTFPSEMTKKNHTNYMK